MATTTPPEPAVEPAVEPADRVARLFAELFDPANRHDPYSRYTKLREAGPLHPGPFGLQLATGHRDCSAVLASLDWGHDREADHLHSTISADAFPASFLWMEPPDHTRLRGLVTKAFTARTVAALRPRIEALVDELLDGALAAGEFDLINTIAYPLPLTIVCEILGVPAADHPLVQVWSQALARAFDPDVLMTPEALAERNAAIPESLDYFRALVARARRDSGGTDLISALAAVEEQGDRLTEDELLGTCVTLLIAGHETTVNLVGNGMLALARHPDQLDLLRRRPDLVTPAVDELLRYDSPIHMNTRAAKRELVVAGHTFAPGDGVVALIACANRDPEVYDDPDRLDVTRYAAGNGHSGGSSAGGSSTGGRSTARRHLGFSLGLHYCLGAPLARMEASTAIATLVQRAPALSLASDDLSYQPSLIHRGLTSLPVDLA